MARKGGEKLKPRESINFREPEGMRSEIDKIKEEIEKIEESRKREKAVQESIKNLYLAEKEQAEKCQEKLGLEKEKREKLEKKVEELERLLQKASGKQEDRVEEEKDKERVEDNSSFDSDTTGQTDLEEVREVQIIYLGKMRRKDLQEEVRKRAIQAIRNDRVWRGEKFENWIREYTKARAWAEAGVKDEEGERWIIFMTTKEMQETMKKYEGKWNGILSSKENQPFIIEEVLTREEREEKERKEKTEKRIEIMERRGERYIRKGWIIGYEGRWWTWDLKERRFTSEEMEDGEERKFCSMSESV